MVLSALVISPVTAIAISYGGALVRNQWMTTSSTRLRESSDWIYDRDSGQLTILTDLGSQGRMDAPGLTLIEV